MAANVEMVHIVHNALVLCLIDSGGGGWGDNLLHEIQIA